jgi:hypothetical protein
MRRSEVRLVVRWAPPTWNFSIAAVWRNYLRCMVLGHDDEIVAGDRVIALRCRQCGWRSSGWHLDSPRESTTAIPSGDVHHCAIGDPFIHG